MESAGRQGVLIDPTVEFVAPQLLRCRIAGGSDEHAGAGQRVMSALRARYTEAGQRNSSPVGRRLADQDVARVDVAVQHAAVVRVVQGVGDRGHDLDDHPRRHAIEMAFTEQLGRVAAIDVLGRDPQLILELAAVGDAGDTRVPQWSRQIGLLVEPLAVIQVHRDLGGNQVKNLLAGKPRMLGDVELSELFVSELPHNAESGGRRSNHQRHGEMVQTGARNSADVVYRVRMSE